MGISLKYWTIISILISIGATLAQDDQRPFRPRVRNQGLAAHTKLRRNELFKRRKPYFVPRNVPRTTTTVSSTTVTESTFDLSTAPIFSRVNISKEEFFHQDYDEEIDDQFAVESASIRTVTAYPPPVTTVKTTRRPIVWRRPTIAQPILQHFKVIEAIGSTTTENIERLTTSPTTTTTTTTTTTSTSTTTTSTTSTTTTLATTTTTTTTTITTTTTTSTTTTSTTTITSTTTLSTTTIILTTTTTTRITTPISIAKYEIDSFDSLANEEEELKEYIEEIKSQEVSFEDIYEETSTMGEPLPPEDLPTEPMFSTEMFLSDYQNDPMYERSSHEIVPVDHGNVPFVQQMKDGVTNLKNGGMMVVVRPQKVTQDTMVYVRYERMSDLSSSAASPVEMTSPTTVAFPLVHERHEVQLENLKQGVYLVCAETVRSYVVIQKDCFLARVLYVQQSIVFVRVSVIIVISLVAVFVLLVLAYGVHHKIHMDRRKQFDKELEARVAKKAEQERERQERERETFHQVYIDPDEPYEERCIM